MLMETRKYKQFLNGLFKAWKSFLVNYLPLISLKTKMHVFAVLTESNLNHTLKYVSAIVLSQDAHQ